MNFIYTITLEDQETLSTRLQIWRRPYLHGSERRLSLPHQFSFHFFVTSQPQMNFSWTAKKKVKFQLWVKSNSYIPVSWVKVSFGFYKRLLKFLDFQSVFFFGFSECFFLDFQIDFFGFSECFFLDFKKVFFGFLKWFFLDF